MDWRRESDQYGDEYGGGDVEEGDGQGGNVNLLVNCCCRMSAYSLSSKGWKGIGRSKCDPTIGELLV